MFRYVGAAILAAIAAPLGAQTEADLEWSRYVYTSFEPSDLGLAIAYGLPESDLVVMRANCMDPGEGETNIRGSFSAILGDAVNGQPILLEFEGLTGGLPVVTATAIGVGAELGITGAMVEFPTSDRLWGHLSEAERLRYRVRGQDDWAEYPGDPAMFSAFRSECSEMGSASSADEEPGASPLPTPAFDATTGIAACSEDDLAASSEDGEPLDLMIQNQGATDLSIFWMNAAAERVEMGLLPAGQSATLGTRHSHIWMIADADGTCLELRSAAGGDMTYGAAPRVDSK